MSTKKLKSVARFGARYGTGVKTRVLDIERKQKQKFHCPKCGFAKVKRKARGIFQCKKCKASFTGGAYLPETLTGSIIKKMVAQKSFLPAMPELLETTEKIKHNASAEKEEELSEKHSAKKHKHKEEEAVEE